MNLPAPKLPSKITSQILALCASINSGVDPVYVDVVPEPSALPQECFPNVRRKIKSSGGRIQFGWAIWQCANFFIEAEHHAVYEAAEGTSYVDITPQIPVIARILFLPDDRAIHDPKITKQTDNRRLALTNDWRLERILSLFSDRTKLLNNSPKKAGQVTLAGDSVRRYVAIEQEIAQLSHSLMQGQINVWKI